MSILKCNTLKSLRNNYKFKIINNILKFILKSLGKFLRSILLINNELNIVLKNKVELCFILLFLKKNYKLQYNQLIDISTVDHFLKAQRFEINYFVLSLKYSLRLRVKLNITEQSNVQSLTFIFLSANWLERENWDLYGIFFQNHCDLRRILTDYGFQGFPFRKDYPLTGYIELRFDNEKKIVIYEKLALTQEFRFFEFTSPWAWNAKI